MYKYQEVKNHLNGSHGLNLTWHKIIYFISCEVNSQNFYRKNLLYTNMVSLRATNDIFNVRLQIPKATFTLFERAGECEEKISNPLNKLN